MTSRTRSGSTPVILGGGYQRLYNGVNFLAFKVGGEPFLPLMLTALRFGSAAVLILPVLNRVPPDQCRRAQY